MSTMTMKEITGLSGGMCHTGKRIAQAWHRTAGNPERVNARTVFKVLKKRYEKPKHRENIRWAWVIRVMTAMMTPHQVGRLAEATKGRPRRWWFAKRNYRMANTPEKAAALLNSMRIEDRMEALEYAFGRS